MWKQNVLTAIKRNITKDKILIALLEINISSRIKNEQMTYEAFTRIIKIQYEEEKKTHDEIFSCG